MKLLSLLLALCLSACTTTGTLDNRMTCTVSGDKAFSISLYGPFGLSSEMNKQDATKICAIAK